MLVLGRSRSLLLAGLGGLFATLLMVFALALSEGLLTVGAGHRVGRSLQAPAPSVPTQGRPLPAGARLLSDRSTASSRTYMLPDGTMVTRLATAPVNYRDRAGRWLPVDPRLAARGDGFVNRGAAFSLSLPRRLSDGVAMSSGTDRLHMRLHGAGGTAAVRGVRATYAGVLPSVTAIYDSQAQGVREQLVIADRSAPRVFTFSLQASAGLVPHLRRDGSITFKRDGRTVFLLPPSVTFPHGDTTKLHAARNELRRAPGGWELTVTPDRAWVLRELAHGPVVLDPTVEIDPDSQDCEIDSGGPTTSYCSSPQMLVGYEAGASAHEHRGLVQFDLSVLPKDAVVLNADFGLTLGGHSTNNLKQVGVYQLKRAWTNSATWNKYDSTSSWGTAGAAGSADADGSPAAVATAGDTSGFVNWYPTKLVQDWLDGTLPNHGFLVRDVTPNTVDNELSFSTREGGSVTPELDIVWSPRTGRLGSYTFDSQRLTDRSSLGVNVANGNLLVSSDDLSVKGTGLDLQLTRSHNSMGTGWGDQAMGIPSTMSLGRDVKLQEFADGSVAFFRGDGVVLPFLNRSVSGGTATFTAPNDLNASLSENTATGVYTLTFNRTEVRFLFDTNGRLTSVKDRNDNTIALAYHTTGFHGLSQITDTQGRTYAVGEKPFDDFLSDITDPSGRTWNYTYADFNDDYLTDYADPAGNHTLYDYDASHRLTQITTPAGNVTKITYDGTSQRVASVKRTTDAGHTTGPTTTYAYSTGTPCGTGETKTVVTDPNSHNTTYCANTKDRVVKVLDAAGNERSRTYTSNGDVNDATNLPGGTGAAGLTSLTYDTDNNLTNVSGAEGESSTIQYYTSSDADGGGGPLAKFRPKQSTDDQGTSEHYKYDSKGNLTSVADAASSPRTKATLTYNSDGTLATATDGNTHTTGFTYSGGNLITISPPAPLAQTHLTSDSLSRVHTVQIGTGVTKTLTYDPLDRVTRLDLSDGSYFTYSYDDDGNLTARADSTGNATSYTVDPLGRRTHEGFPSSRSNDYTYDAAGNLKTVVDGAGTVTYTYDLINRVKTIVSPTASGGSTDTVSYDYDDPNRTQTMTLPGSTTEKYAYDKSGNTTSITVKNSGGTTLRSLAYDYSYVSGTTKHGSLIRSVTDQTGQKTIYTYKDGGVPDDVGRLIKARVETSGGALVEEFRYSYDAAGNRTKLEDQTSGGTTTRTMAYDNANELCWKYTGTSSNACGSAPSGATSYTFDNHGNQTAAGATSYSYDALERATGLAGTSASYLTPDNTELVAYGTTSFQNNLLGLSRQFAPSSTTNYVRDPTGTPVSQRTSASKQFFLNDTLGSTIALTDTTGAIVRSYTYDPDGNTTTTGSGATTDLKYAAGHQLAGLTHFAARYHDAGTARWTQQDPINQYDDLVEANRFGYAGDDPVNNTDPTGTDLFSEVLDKVAHAIHKPSNLADGYGQIAARVAVGIGAYYGYKYVYKKGVKELGKHLPHPGHPVGS